MLRYGDVDPRTGRTVGTPTTRSGRRRARRVSRRRTARTQAMYPAPGVTPTPSPYARGASRRRQRQRIRTRQIASILSTPTAYSPLAGLLGEDPKYARASLRRLSAVQRQQIINEGLVKQYRVERRQYRRYQRQQKKAAEIIEELKGDDPGGVFGTGIGPDIGSIDVDESALTKPLFHVPIPKVGPGSQSRWASAVPDRIGVSPLDIASIIPVGRAAQLGLRGARAVVGARAANVAAARASARAALSARQAERLAAAAGRADAPRVAAAEARAAGRTQTAKAVADAPTPALVERAAAVRELELAAAKRQASLGQRAGAYLSARAATRRSLGARITGRGPRGATAKPGLVLGAGSGTGVGGALAAAPLLPVAAGQQASAANLPQVPVQLAIAAGQDPQQFAAASGKSLFETLVGIPGFVVMSGEAAAQAASTGGQDTTKLNALIEMVKDDYVHRYGPIVEGDFEEFRKRALKTGITPFALDALVAAPTLGRAAGAAAREGFLGYGAQKLATAERPRLALAGGEVPEGEALALPPVTKTRPVSRSLFGAAYQKKVIDPLAVRRTARKAKDGDAFAVQAQRRGQIVRARTHHGLSRDVGAAYGRGRQSMRSTMAQAILRGTLREGARLTPAERRGIFEATIYKADTPEKGRQIVQARIDRIQEARAADPEKFPEGWDEIPELEWIRDHADEVFTPKLAEFARGQAARGEELARLDPALTQERAELRRVKPAAQLLGVEKFQHVHTPSKGATTKDAGVRSYFKALKKALDTDKGFMLSPLRKRELKKLDLFLSRDGKTGAWIKTHPDGTRELGGLFNVGGYKGAGSDLLRLAEANGVTKLDVFDVEGGPKKLYERHGWYEVKREKFDPQYAPKGWEDTPLASRPDVVFMERRLDRRTGVSDRRVKDVGPPKNSAERRKLESRREAERLVGGQMVTDAKLAHVRRTGQIPEEDRAQAVEARIRAEAEELPKQVFEGLPEYDQRNFLLARDRYRFTVKDVTEDSRGATRITANMEPKTGANIGWVPGDERRTFDTKIAEVKDGKPVLKDGSGYTTTFPLKAEEGYIYRGISAGEMDSIRATGQIRSRGEYNIGGAVERDTTLFATDPEKALSYASGFAPWPLKPTYERPSYVLKVEKDGITRREAENIPDDFAAEGSIPISAIEEVVEVRPYSIRSGEVDLADAGYYLERGNVRTGGRSAPITSDAYKKMSAREFVKTADGKRVAEEQIAQKTVEDGPKQNLPGVRGETTAEYMQRTMRQLGKFYGDKDIDLELPGYFAEAVRQPGKAHATYALGGQRSVADPHAYHGTLNKLGIVDRRLYALAEGQARNIKRAYNWNFVADVFERHTFPWSRDKSLFELMRQVEQKKIKGGYVFVNMGKLRRGQGNAVDVDTETLRRAGADGIAEAIDDTGGLGGVLKEAVRTPEEMRELGRLSDNPDQFMQQKGWALMPDAVNRELQSGAKQSLLGRAAAIATITQSRMLLGSLNLPWLQFQVMSNGFLAGLAGTGPLDMVKSVKWWRGLTDAQREAIGPYIGTGHFSDSVGQQRLGKATTSNLVNTYQGLKETVGGRVIWAGKKNYAQVRDLNPMDLMFRADNAQNNFFRRAVFYSQLKRQAYDSMGGRMKAIGRSQTGLLEALAGKGPTEQMAVLARDVRNVEKHAEQVADFLGDYQTFTHVERDYLKRNVMFYSFLRFSLRFAFYTMPVKHPVMTGLLGQLSRMQAEEVRDLLGGHQLPFGLGRVYHDNGKMVIDLSRANPVMSALTQSGGAGGITGKMQGFAGLAPPLYAAIVSQLYNIETFTGKPLLVEGSPSPLKYLGMNMNTRARVLLNDALQLYFPYRAAEDLIYKGGQPGADSLVFDPRMVQYVDEEIKRSQRKVSESYPQDILGGIQKAIFPYLPRPSNDIEIAKSLREKIEEERESRYGRGGSAAPAFRGYGGGGGGGGSSGGFNGY